MKKLFLVGPLLYSLVLFGQMGCEENQETLRNPGDPQDPELQLFLETFGKPAGTAFPYMLGLLDRDSRCFLGGSCFGNDRYVDSLETWMITWSFGEIEYVDAVQFLTGEIPVRKPDTGAAFALITHQEMKAESV